MGFMLDGVPIYGLRGKNGNIPTDLGMLYTIKYLYVYKENNVIHIIYIYI